MQFWLKMTLIILWTLIIGAFGTVQAFFHWGKRRYFAPAVHLLAGGVLRIVGIRFESEGLEHMGVHHPSVYVGNHQSFFDVIAYGSIVPNDCVPIGKKEIINIPVIGWWFVGHGAILIDRKNREKAFSELDKAVSIMKNEKISIGILPEGTRNFSRKELLPFKKGAFHMAIKAQAPITPIVFSHYQNLISFESRRLKSGTIYMKALPPVMTKGLTTADTDALIEKVRNQMIDAYNEVNEKAGVK